MKLERVQDLKIFGIEDMINGKANDEERFKGILEYALSNSKEI